MLAREPAWADEWDSTIRPLKKALPPTLRCITTLHWERAEKAVLTESLRLAKMITLRPLHGSEELRHLRCLSISSSRHSIRRARAVVVPITTAAVQSICIVI